MKGKRQYLFKPIGIVHTPYKSKSGVPIQGVFDSGSRASVDHGRERAVRQKGYDFSTHFFLTPPGNLSIVQAPYKAAIDAFLGNPSTSSIATHPFRER